MSIESVNPATGETIKSYPPLRDAEVNEIVGRVHEAFLAWRGASMAERAQRLRTVAAVLRGRDPLQGLATDRADLRRQVEHEVRGKLLHLRTEYAAAAGDGKALGRLLEASLGAFLILLRATLRLKGVKPPADRETLVREAAKATGLDVAPFEWALAKRAGRPAPALKAFDPVAAAYVDAIERLAEAVDRL